MTEPTISLSPATVPVSTAPDGQATTVTLTLTNNSAADLDASGGITFQFLVDPGTTSQPGEPGTNSASGLLASTYSFGIPPGTDLAASPALTAAPAQGTDWPDPHVLAGVPVIVRALPRTKAAGTIGAGTGIAFEFGVVAGPVTGASPITVTLASSTGSITMVTTELSKVDPPAGVSLSASPDIGSSLPSNQWWLSWTVSGPADCALAWDPTQAAQVSYLDPASGSWTSEGSTWSPAPTQPAARSVRAVLQADTTFTLTAPSSNPVFSLPMKLTLDPPTFTALTIPPVVTGISPAAGLLAGGEQVTITGTGFLDATQVSFGAVQAPSFSVADSGTQITATAPAGSGPGTVSVTVTTPACPSAATPAGQYGPDQYGYADATVPVVSGLSPAAGSTAGDPVTITGTGFTAGSTVTFGGLPGIGPAADATGTLITVTAPPSGLAGSAAAGIVDVQVTNAGGTSTSTPASRYTYTADNVPMVTMVARADGSVPYGNPAGGELVTISGSGLTGTAGQAGAVRVLFGEVSASVVADQVSDTEIVVVTPALPLPTGDGASQQPPATPVLVTVSVPAPGGGPVTSPAVPAAWYTYASTPAAQSVAPHERFRLVWGCYPGTGPRLTWTSIGGDAPAFDPALAVGAGGALSADAGAVIVQIDSQTTFSLEQATPIGPGNISLGPIDMKGLPPLIILTAGNLTVDGSSGVQYADFTWQGGTAANPSTWQAANASYFVFSGGITGTQTLPYNQYTLKAVPLNTVGQAPLLSEFTVTAHGYDATTKASASESSRVAVTPAPVKVSNVTVSPVQYDPGTGWQHVVLGWLAQNATSVQIIGGAALVTPLVSDTSAIVYLPPPSGPPSPAQYDFVLTADGYVDDVTPHIVVVEVSPLEVSLGQPVAKPTTVSKKVPSSEINWTVANAYTLTMKESDIIGTTNLGPGQTSVTVSPTDSTRYYLTANGYTSDPQLPTGNVLVSFDKGGVKDHKDGKDGSLAEKQATDSPFIAGPAAPAGPPAPEPPGGGQRAFIAPDQRPDVGASLRTRR